MDFSKSFNTNSNIIIIDNNTNNANYTDTNIVNSNLLNSSEEVIIDDTIYKSISFANDENVDLKPPQLTRRLNIELENRDR